MSKKRDDTINAVRIRGKIVRDIRYGRGQKSAYAFVTIVTGSGDYSAFHKVAAFGALADEMRQAQKDDIVEVEGRISYKKQEKGEAKWYEASIIADKIVNHSLEASNAAEEEPISDDDIPF